jgi:predicted alpha/beta-hydrolase family hydrolase
MTQLIALVGGKGRDLPGWLDRPAGRGPVRGGIVLAHGAGGTSLTPFIARAAAGLSAAGWAVLRFNFGYAEAGGRPSRADRADAPEHADYRAALSALADALPPDVPIVLSGKSYGGRVATFILAEAANGPDGSAGAEGSDTRSAKPAPADPAVERVRGLIVFGYPIRPPVKDRPADLAALRAVRQPILVVQGSRDSLGPLEALREALEGADRAEIAVVEGGDHSYRAPGPRAVTVRLEDEAVADAVGWLERLS